MTQAGRDMAHAVEEAIAPVLEVQGFEVVLVEYVPRSRILRVFIDHANGVSIDDCTSVSHRIGDLLDAEGFSDRFTEQYTLEVSSPGLDRPLVKPSHFQRFVGCTAHVQTNELQDGRRRFRGELLEADDSGIQIDVDGKVRAIRYEDIDRARLVPDI